MLKRTLVDRWEDDATVADLIRAAEGTGHAFIGVCGHMAVPDNDAPTPTRSGMVHAAWPTGNSPPTPTRSEPPPEEA